MNKKEISSIKLTPCAKSRKKGQNLKKKKYFAITKCNKSFYKGYKVSIACGEDILILKVLFWSYPY